MYSTFKPLDKVQKQYRRCYVRKCILRNFEKFTGKRLCQILFYDKFAHLKPVTLLKKRPWHRCFPVNFAKFVRMSFLQNTSGRLLPKVWDNNIYYNNRDIYLIF